MKRLTGYYVIQKQGNKVFVSHQPRWFFYFADKKKFFDERRRAYQKLSDLLREKSFWPNAKFVYSRSLTIDFGRDFEQSTEGRLHWYDKPGTVILWFLNVYNWRFHRISKFIRMLFVKRVSEFQVDRNTFICALERR